jgi:hypothetical protein
VAVFVKLPPFAVDSYDLPTTSLIPITDAVLHATLYTLGRCGFLEGAPATPAASPEALRSLHVTITARGREALAGAIDRVHECGIDDWRGGVRLAGNGPVWRWDGAQRKLFEK